MALPGLGTGPDGTDDEDCVGGLGIGGGSIIPLSIPLLSLVSPLTIEGAVEPLPKTEGKEPSSINKILSFFRMIMNIIRVTFINKLQR